MAIDKTRHDNREGKDLEWCEERAETLGRDAADVLGEYIVVHLCRHGVGHVGPHQCWLCSTTWDGQEVPC